MSTGNGESAEGNQIYTVHAFGNLERLFVLRKRLTEEWNDAHPTWTQLGFGLSLNFRMDNSSDISSGPARSRVYQSNSGFLLDTNHKLHTMKTQTITSQQQASLDALNIYT